MTQNIIACHSLIVWHNGRGLKGANEQSSKTNRCAWRRLAMMRALGAALLMAFANAWALPHAHAADSAKPGQPAYRISDGVIRVGVITDMSAVYKDLSGVGSVLAARMAIEDFGGSIAGFPIELLDADHHNEADQAGRIARDWLERGKVDMVVDVPNSAAALEVIKAAKASGKIAII
ncbi:MAG TPA: ABC transporter substrate-binding protein, partial [Burkholderiales bacterium]|nr:ABC transporter substrate-binding protein [Burkholderiales bacterium]